MVIVHVLTGFLGAGKTTVLAGLLAQKPPQERWGLLINEFGRIGIDPAVLAATNVVVKSVPGGCLCCAQQLSLQIALGQLAAEPGLTRLFIEPSGLGHPAQLLDILVAPHWQALLQPGAHVTVVDAAQWQEARYRTHETYEAQLAVADVFVLSKCDRLSESEQFQMITALQALAPEQRPVLLSAVPEDRAPADGSTELLTQLTTLMPRHRAPVRRSLLHAQTPAQQPQVAPPQDPPWHYHEARDGRFVGGWVLPPAWVFDADALTRCLMAWPDHDAVRLKGVMHTTSGWLFFNTEGAVFSVRSSEYRADNRLEWIGTQAPDWTALEASLMACRTPLTPTESDQQQQQ